MASSATPMMKQYGEIKSQHRDAILFFRLGDFYEMFFEDAVFGSKALGLTLTKRQDVPMCGVPFHAAEGYIGRLTKIGKKVAICDQVSDPNLPGIVSREVVRVVTPGTTFDDRVLDQKQNQFIISVAGLALAACDATTGEFFVWRAENLGELRDEIARISPAECVMDQVVEAAMPEFLHDFSALPVFPHKQYEAPDKIIKDQFGILDLAPLGFAEDLELVTAAALLVSYLRETQKTDVAHLNLPKRILKSDEVILDEPAVRNLELVTNLREQTRDGSLLSVLDHTQTSMGARMLRSLILRPLKNLQKIEARLDAVSELIQNFEARTALQDQLKKVMDMQRLLARISVGTGNARDVLGIGLSLSVIAPVKEWLKNLKGVRFAELREVLNELAVLEDLHAEILKIILDAPPLSVRDGGMIRDGVDMGLDELRTISRDGKAIIARMQETEIARTGINSLKIRYNQVFGYYIEITKSHLDKIPADYIRKQTLVNAERYITPELKEYEEKVLGAEEKMKAREYEIFSVLREKVKVHTREIQAAAEMMATIDTLLSFAIVARKNQYVRPQMGESGTPLVIENGRHPVVESLAGARFVPNDTRLADDLSDKANASDRARVLLITGPNMGGKSTYLRQVALIALMAHIGCFVPANRAHIPLLDRIFTRVGASDNLVRGQSTFMVEMQETAQILHHATKDSLIILDEIGRGTSTYDGVSLAWAILEFIHNDIGAKTLFATHYHELIPVAERLEFAENVSVAVKEEKGSVVFLYRVLKGAIDRSYGIEVARLAGLPRSVIEKSKHILEDLEEGILDCAVDARASKDSRDANQIGMFEAAQPPREHRVITELKETDVNSLTPLDALKKLDEWKKGV